MVAQEIGVIGSNLTKAQLWVLTVDATDGTFEPGRKRRPARTSSAIEGISMPIRSPATCRDGSKAPSGGALVKVAQVLAPMTTIAIAAAISI